MPTPQNPLAGLGPAHLTDEELENIFLALNRYHDYLVPQNQEADDFEIPVNRQKKAKQ